VARETRRVSDQASRRSRRLSVELKYATIAVLIVTVFVVLHAAGAFSGVNDTVTDGVDRLAGLGSIGIFLVALIANLSILKTGKARAVRFSTLAAICEALQCQPGELLEFRHTQEKEAI